MTEWRHVYLNAATWFVPKENVKGSRGKQQEQLVFLSGFALEQFKTLHNGGGNRTGPGAAKSRADGAASQRRETPIER